MVHAEGGRHLPRLAAIPAEERSTPSARRAGAEQIQVRFPTTAKWVVVDRLK